MRSLQREVESYRDDNENIMKYQEEILHILNIIEKQINKNSGTKQEASARKVEVSRSHDRRDYHGGYIQSKNVSRHHHSLGNLNKV
jgi:pSer/pThr/pTyr-binding forkhead associated (FHA) protein